MPTSFVSVSEHLAELLATHALLTPNERLAREYRRSFDDFQLAHGLTGWRTPKILSLSQFLSVEYERARRLGVASVAPVSRSELITRAFLSPKAPAERDVSAFLNAWQMTLAYDIPLHAQEFSAARVSSYGDWMRDVRNGLPARAVDEERIGDALLDLDFAPSQSLLLTDIDQYTNPQRRYLDFAAQRVDVRTTRLGGEILSWPAQTQASAARHARGATMLACSSLGQELIAAARWARSHLMADPAACIGIVVPALAGHYARVARQIGVELDPERGSSSRSFDIAAGVPLGDQQVWRDAVQLLAACDQGLTPGRARRLASARHLQLARLPWTARTWPTHDARALPLAVVLDAIQDVPGLLQAVREFPRRGDYADFLACYRRVLSLAGWPNTTAIGSFQFQAWEAIERIFEHSAASAPRRQLEAPEAFALLQAHLRDALFAPERPAAAIQVCGLLETTGLTFTHLWVCGMDEDALPGRHATHPFVPNRVARACGVPRSSPALELEFAERLLAGWSESAGELRFSFTNRADESERQPSALLAHLPRLDWEDAEPHPYNTAAGPATGLEHFVDESGRPVPAVRQAGGSGVLQAQADCPFKAYAQYRLGLRREESLETFPGAARRGSLMHACLAELLSENPDQSSLVQTSTANLRAICERVLSAEGPALPPLFVDHETDRLTRNLSAWIDFERERAQFRAVQVEQSHVLELGHSEFAVRVDRIDQVGDAFLVLDYKTGTVRGIDGLAGSTLRDVQLPLYGLLEERTRGVYYAVNDGGRWRVQGVADAAAALAGARTVSPADWPAQQHAWRRALSDLAAAFERGAAAVAPVAGACEHCHLASLCRIGNRRR